MDAATLVVARVIALFDQGPASPCPDPFNMAAHVLARGAHTPDKLALRIIGGQDWTYAALIAAVRGIAAGLQQRGLSPGDIVLMRLGNTVDFPLAYLGALAAGLVPVPTSSALTEREIARIIDDLAPALIIRDPQVACPDHPVCLQTDALRAMHDLPPAEWHMGDPERLGYIIYTSGTSGQPRAVCHAHRAIWARQMMFDGWYGLCRDDRLMHAGAFNWTYTLGTGLMDPWTMGATALIPAPGTKPAELPDLMQSTGATIFAAAPGVYRQMLRAELPDLPKLRHGLSAGEKLPDVTRTAWQNATGKPIFEAYGMSECSTFISSNPAHPAEPSTLGRPQKGRRVAILGDDGPVNRGEEGTIAIHRSDPGLMLGYLGAKQETNARLQGDWFLTGDRGVMDLQDQITYLGRNDDMMNAGGFRVSPLEVEKVLAEMDGVTAIGVTDVNVGNGASIIAAFYTAPHEIDDTAWQGFAKDRLARYKQPRAYIHLAELPISANGKLIRRALKPLFKDAVS